MPAQPDGDDHPPEMGRRMMTSASAGGWSGSKFSVTSAHPVSGRPGVGVHVAPRLGLAYLPAA